MRLLATSLLVTAIASLHGCSSTDAETAPATAAGPDAGATSEADAARANLDDDGGPPPPPSGCPRTPKADDHARKVVVSHPFLEDGERASAFEVLELSTTGELTKTGQTFAMRPAFAQIVFTPDGEVGLLPHEDGSIGVFTFDAEGKVKVVHEAFAGSFSARRLVMAKDGSHVFVLDPNTEGNGGGVRRMTIGCDGSLTDEGVVVTGGRAHAMALLPNAPGQAILLGAKALGSPDGTYAHRLDVSASAVTRLASGPVFGDEDAIASSVAVTLDGKYALVTDNGHMKGSRMAPVALSDMTSRATIDTPSPAGVVLSPFGNALLLMNSDGQDALRVVRYDSANDTAPFAITEQIATKGGNTELPTHAAVIGRGTLKGRVLVAEVSAVRQLAFAADGSITDLDAAATFDGIAGIVGSLGVEP